MTKNTFNKPPVTAKIEKEKKAEDFINQIDKIKIDDAEQEKQPTIKEQKKAFILRMPESQIQELKEMTALTGISRNAICLELLRPAIKSKLKELLEK